MKKNLLSGIAIICFSITNAQFSTLTSGGEIIGNNGIVNFSVGLPTAVLQNDTGFSIYNTPNQPYEISTLNAVEVSDSSIEVKIYPNPMSEFLFFQVNNNTGKNYNFFIRDFSGITVKKGLVNKTHQSVNVSEIKAGVYILEIADKDKTLNIYKLIKK